jgi:exodeoxyribonuclease VII large subunit
MFDTKGVMSSRVGSGQLSLSLEPERRIFRVSELNAAVQRRFEEEFSGIWVAGEISSCKVAASGHYYFSLKDDKSQLRCALFKGAARFVKFKPVDGLAVIARGKLEVYEARGEYQLIVEALEPQGAGALQIAFEQMKKRLAMEGLFDAARKRALPRLPKRIGIVTSPAGSVIRDMLHVFERRFPGLHVRLYPAQVQGEGALEQVCAGLNYFSNAQWAEVVILARGGGSLEDLWTFNEEAVARAIAASSVPVISAIGHETDFKQRLQERGTERAEALIQRAIRRRVQRVDESESQLRRSGKSLVDSARRRLDDLRRRLQATDLRLRFARHRHALELLRQRFENAMYDRVRGANRRLEDCQLHLRQLSPLNVLSRGYAIVEDGNGRVLRSSAETALGDRVRVRLYEGRLTAEVTEIEG